MACLVSVSFFTLLRTPPVLLQIRPQDLCPRKSLARVSSQANAGTAPTLLATCNFNVGIYSVNRIPGHHILTPSRRLFEIDSCPWNVGSCTNMVIAGYWVGPDIDDGWGFIEAFVNQIT